MLDTLGDRGTLELKDIIKERRKRSEIITTTIEVVTISDLLRIIENVLQLQRAPVPQGVQHQAGGALQEVPGQVPAPGDDQVKMSGQASDVMI